VITVDDSKKKSDNIWYNKFMNLAERVSNLIYGDMDIKKFINKLKSKLLKPPKVKDEKIPDMITSYVNKEKDTRKFVGIGVLSIIILSILIFILYILNGIFNILFNIITWWAVAILMIAILGPIMLAVAYAIGKGDY